MKASCSKIGKPNRQTNQPDHKMRGTRIRPEHPQKAPLPRKRPGPSALHDKMCMVQRPRNLHIAVFHRLFKLLQRGPSLRPFSAALCRLKRRCADCSAVCCVSANGHFKMQKYRN
jgi:hypothetical protein